MPTFRVDFHHHVKGDPVDLLGYTVFDLIDRAVEKGIHALAITPHGNVFCDEEARRYAEQRGVLLIFGVEKRVGRKEVLLLNVVPDEIPTPMSFEDLRVLRARKGEDLLVIAPHPYYPSDSCVGDLLDVYPELFDGVEYAHLHLPCYNPNDRAVEWARSRQKPILANSDTHGLFMFGHNFTEVKSDQLTIPSIFLAIRNRSTRAIAHAPTWMAIFRFAFQVTAFQYLIRKIFPSRRKGKFLD